jgi:hypothetical protein
MNRRKEFKTLFCDDHDVPNATPLENLKKKALEGYFHDTNTPANALRSVAWKILLGKVYHCFL